MNENPHQGMKMIFIPLGYILSVVLPALLFSIALPFAVATFIGLCIGAAFIVYTLEKVVQTIEGNKILLTTDIFVPNPKDRTGATVFNGYTEGLRLLWWWEKIGDTIVLDTKSYQGPVLVASTLTDELIVSYQYDVTPNPRFVSKLALMGKEAEKDIQMKVETIVEKIIETIFIKKDAANIVADRKAIRNDIQAELGLTTYQDEFNNLGVTVSVTSGKIDFTPEMSRARQQKELITLDKEAADLLTKAGADPSVTTKEALAHIRARAGVTTSQDHHFHIPPGVRVVPIVGGGGKP